MNKNKKEKVNNKKNLVLEIIFYLLIILIGFYLIETSSIKIIDKLFKTEFVLYIISFLSILLYVINRREKDYEYLEFGLINALTSVFIQINESYSKPSVVISNAFIIFSFLYLVSKIYNSYKLYKKKDINYILKIAISLIMFIVGISLSLEMFSNYLLSDYILGNYYLLFGIVSLLEPLIEFLLRNPKLEYKIKEILKYSQKEKKKKVIVREVPEKKIAKIK